MLTIRTPNGSIRELSLHHPPLRLSLSIPTSSTGNPAQELPYDAVRRIFLFLERKSQDWLAADSCCRSWRAAAQPLWQGERASTVVRRKAARTIRARWSKLHGFLPRETYRALCGPASTTQIEALQTSAHPWKIPPVFLESLRVHDGQRDTIWTNANQQGMYLGSRLLTVIEIVHTLKAWRKQAQDIQAMSPQGVPPHANTVESAILRVPLFSERGSRQVVMELQLGYDNQLEERTLLPHGRIVLVSSVAPFAPHFRVLADSWDGFLTLI